MTLFFGPDGESYVYITESTERADATLCPVRSARLAWCRVKRLRATLCHRLGPLFCVLEVRRANTESIPGSCGRGVGRADAHGERDVVPAHGIAYVRDQTLCREPGRSAPFPSAANSDPRTEMRSSESHPPKIGLRAPMHRRRETATSQSPGIHRSIAGRHAQSRHPAGAPSPRAGVSPRVSFPLQPSGQRCLICLVGLGRARRGHQRRTARRAGHPGRARATRSRLAHRLFRRERRRQPGERTASGLAAPALRRQRASEASRRRAPRARPCPRLKFWTPAGLRSGQPLAASGVVGVTGTRSGRRR